MATFTFVVVFIFAGTNVFAQSSERKVGISFMRSIIIDVESNMSITFVEGDSLLNEVSVLDVDDRGDVNNRQAGLIRVTGASVETMIDVEVQTLRGLDGDDKEVFSVRDFNLINENAGNIVTVMPFSDENSYIFPIGGTIEGVPDSGKVYAGINVVNINYL